ncbi:MAG: FkbM family methyltransferase [Sphingobium sp.]|nr:FkbM family methyltransferase [Sphingobium sp.]
MNFIGKKIHHLVETINAKKKIVDSDGFWVPGIEADSYAALPRFEDIPDQDVGKLKQVVDLIPRRHRALDIGANIGTTASLLSKHFEKVHAFEPAYDLFAALKRNLARYKQARVYQCAVGETAGEVYLTQYAKRGQLSHLDGGTPIKNAKWRKVGPIPLRTIDSFGFADVSFIKIDVEGFEGPVVRGATETIKRCRPAIMVEQAGNEQKYFGLPANEASEFLEGLGMVQHPNPPWMAKDRLYIFAD